MNADVFELLRSIRDTQRELLAEMRGLRVDLAGHRTSGAAPALRKDQAEALAEIAPVLAAIFGETRFQCWEVIDRSLPQTAEGANIRLVLGDRSARELGKLFQAATGHDCDRLRVMRDGENGGGVWWVIKPTGLP